MAEKRVNTNPVFTPPSAEELAVLQDPRVLALRTPNPHLPLHIVFQPREPLPEPSRFLDVQTHYDSRTSNRLEWRSWPRFQREVGRGCGFSGVKERPSAFQNVPCPKKPPHVWSPESLAPWLVVSPEVRDIFCRHGADAVEFCGIDWEYCDGTRLEGYGLLDVINLLPAYDYTRSRIDVKRWGAHDELHVEMCTPIVLRTDIPPEVHFLREERWRRLYVSRDLAAELAPFAAKDLIFTDPHRYYTVVEFDKRRKTKPAPSAPPPAIVHDLPRGLENPTSDWRRRSNEIEALLDAGQFRAAEDTLCAWLRELPESPLHVAIAPGIEITTPPREVAAYLDSFVAEAAKTCEPKVLYAELNGFEINPDAWTFGLYAFSHRSEGHEWLGDFYAATERECVVRGLEPLQSVYAARENNRELLKGHDDARRLVALLVIVRFQRLLQKALAHSSCRVPLLAGAHDMGSEYVVEIERGA